MNDEERAAYVAKLLADAPPLSARQREIVRGALGDGAMRRRRNAACDDAATYGKVAS